MIGCQIMATLTFNTLAKAIDFEFPNKFRIHLSIPSYVQKDHTGVYSFYKLKIQIYKNNHNCTDYFFKDKDEITVEEVPIFLEMIEKVKPDEK